MCLQCDKKKLDFEKEQRKIPAMADILQEEWSNKESVDSEQKSIEETSERVIPNPSNLVVEQPDHGQGGGGSQGADGIMRYFVQSTVNVRSGAGTGHALVGSLAQGQIIHAVPGSGLDRAHTVWNNGWGWVQMPNNGNWVAGWSGTGFSNAGAGHLLPVHQVPIFQTQVNGQVNFRVGPGTEFSTGQVGNFLSLPAGTRLNINQFIARHSLPWSFTVPSRDLTRIWLRFSSIITPNGDLLSGQGWVRADLVVNVPPSVIQPSAPLMGTANVSPRIAVVMSPTLNRRTGPGTHTATAGQHTLGQVLNVTRSQLNITEGRTWFQTDSNQWVASENTALVERINRNFIVSAPQANIRNAPAVSGTTIIGAQSSNTRLRLTHRRRVEGDMDWFRFDQVIGGASTVGWIADVNGFIEGEIGSPGVSMPENTAFPFGWIDSRAVSMRNPSYIPGSSNINHRPFYSLRNPGEIDQIILHHTANTPSLTRIDLEAWWRGLGWWNGGYHEIIHADGRVEVCYEPSVVTNGAYGHNRTAFHIALAGDFRVEGAGPTVAQITALTRRIQLSRQQFDIPLQRVFGHSERTATICPGLNMDMIRDRVLGGSGTPTQPIDELQFVSMSEIRHKMRRFFTIIPLGEFVPYYFNLTIGHMETIATPMKKVKIKAGVNVTFDDDNLHHIYIVNGQVAVFSEFNLSLLHDYLARIGIGFDNRLSELLATVNMGSIAFGIGVTEFNVPYFMLKVTYDEFTHARGSKEKLSFKVKVLLKKKDDGDKQDGQVQEEAEAIFEQVIAHWEEHREEILNRGLTVVLAVIAIFQILGLLKKGMFTEAKIVAHDTFGLIL